MRSQADYDNRINLALQWKGATETTGERVLTSNVTPDEELTTLMDERVKAGVVANSQLQASGQTGSGAMPTKRRWSRFLPCAAKCWP